MGEWTSHEIASQAVFQVDGPCGAAMNKRIVRMLGQEVEPGTIDLLRTADVEQGASPNASRHHVDLGQEFEVHEVDEGDPFGWGGGFGEVSRCRSWQLAYECSACMHVHRCVCIAVPVVGTCPGRHGCGRLARIRRMQRARS